MRKRWWGASKTKHRDFHNLVQITSHILKHLSYITAEGVSLSRLCYTPFPHPGIWKIKPGVWFSCLSIKIFISWLPLNKTLSSKKKQLSINKGRHLCRSMTTLMAYYIMYQNLIWISIYTLKTENKLGLNSDKIRSNNMKICYFCL